MRARLKTGAYSGWAMQMGPTLLLGVLCAGVLAFFTSRFLAIDLRAHWGAVAMLALVTKPPYGF